ncbi:MAG: extracellular solute-binding protein [Anaerolineae bacterium]|nr:extracellular solute-binding protein [Anaerolineae bacterium]
MSRVRLFLLLSVVLVASLLTACATPTPEVIYVTEETTKKPLLMWASYDLTDEENPPSVTLNQAIQTFQATTGIEVIYEQVAWDQMPTKLAVQAQSGGDMPDVVEASSQHVLALINAGALKDISGMVEDTPWYANLNPSEAQSCVIDGARYCVAADIRGGAWYYDVADFPDGWPTTAEEWLVEGERLAAEGRFVSTFFAGRHYGAVELSWGPWFYSNGGSIFDAEGKPDWASEENVAVVEWARELLASGYVPETCFTGDFTAGETPWIEGAAASVRGGSWSYLFIPGLQDKYEAGETQLGVAPSFNGGTNYVFLVGEGWAVAEGSENPEGALAWINFFMNPQILAQWASQHYGIPTIDEAFTSSDFAGAFYQETAENLANNGIFIEPSGFYVESLTKLAETLQELLLDPELDIMEQLQAAQEEILNRYW